MDTTHDLIGAADAAERLGVSRAHLTRLVRRGALPTAGKMPGATGAYVFSAETVEAVRQARMAAAEETRAAS